MGDTKRFRFPADVNVAWAKSVSERFKKRFGPKALVFLFFVFLSTILWLSMVLGEQYFTEISYPVRYYNFPKNKVLVNDLPESLNIRVNANGNVILKYKVQSRINPIAFDVNSFSLMEGKESTEFYVLTDVASQRIQNQLDANIQIIEISPDTLFFELAEVVNKKIPVNPNIEYSIAKQYIQKGDVMLSPDSVIVSGPSSIVDTIQTAITLPESLINVSDTISGSLKIPKQEKLKFTPDEVDYKIMVEQFTETSIEIPIQVSNSPDTLTVKLFPKDVDVSFRVGLSDYDKAIPGLFKASVDFNDISEERKKLKVTLDSKPDFVEQVRIFPQHVEYIVER